MKTTMIELKHVYKHYQSKNKQVHPVLKNINLRIEEGEFVAIMGASGSGKSTLLYVMSGLDQASEGEVRMEEISLASMNEKRLSAFRLSHMGFVFQQSHLLKNLNLYENVLLPARMAHRDKPEEQIQRVDTLMKDMGIYDIRKQAVNEASGGQLQRAGICRALVNEPRLLFADEPTGALHSKASKEVMDIFNQLHEEGATIVLVTHDGKVSARADRVLFMKDGELQGDEYLGTYDGNDEKREAFLFDKMRQYDL